jgi:hypothetical protein
MGRAEQRNWERNRVGQYTVARRYEGAGSNRGAAQPLLGKVYEAFNPATGNPCLLVAPATEGEWGHLQGWQVRATVGGSPAHCAVELEKVPEEGQLPELTLGLYRLAQALARVEDRPEALSALVGARALARKARARWRARAGYWGALAAAAVVGVVVWGAGGGERAGRADYEISKVVKSGERRLAGVAEVAAVEAGPVAVAPYNTRASALGLPMPKKPWEGQRVAPCSKGEKEIQLKEGKAGCWIKVDFDAETCKERGYEHKGGCYLPSYPAPQEPQAVRK